MEKKRLYVIGILIVLAVVMMGVVFAVVNKNKTNNEKAAIYEML